MKRVLFIDHTCVVGGAQLVLLNYLKYLPKKKFSLFVICSKDQPFLIKQYSKYAKVFPVDFAPLKRPTPTILIRYLRTLLKTLQIVRSNDIDVIASNTERALYIGTIASFLSHKKLVWFIRDYKYNELFLKLLQIFNPSIFCVSKSIKDYYLFDNAKIIYVSSDMHSKVAKVSDVEVLKFKKKYDLENKLVIGFVGSLVKWKGYHKLIEAFSDIKSNRIVCLICGETDSFKENIDHLENVKRSLNGKKIVFTGFVKNPEVIYKSLDIFVHPALEPEPYATSIIEAMMAKVPVVATKTGGTPEAVLHNKTGLLVKPDNSLELTNAVKSLISNKTLRRKLSAQAYDSVMKHNKIEEEVAKVGKLIESL